MSSPTVSGEANRGLSTEHANQMYWLSGLAPVATNLVTPLIVFWRMRSVSKMLLVKYNQQVNEVGRQFISGTIGLLAYFGGGELTRGALNAMGWGKGPSQKSDSDQQMGMMLGGTLMNFLGYAILRPMISTPFICKFLKGEGQEIALNKEQIYALLEKARKLKVRLETPSDIRALVDAEIVALARKNSGVSQVESFPLRQIQKWIDKHLFDTPVKPLLGKTAGVATLALASWFSAVTAVLYGLNQALGDSKAKKPSVSPPLPLPPWMSVTRPALELGPVVPPPKVLPPSSPYSSGNLYPSGY